MPIRVDLIYKMPEGTDTKERVLIFLKKNKKYAYTSKEISDNICSSEDTVRSALRSLVRKNIVKMTRVGKTFYYNFIPNIPSSTKKGKGGKK